MLIDRTLIPSEMKRVYKPNLVFRPKAGGDHSSRPFVTEWLERPTRKRIMERAAPTFPYLALHREEFTWPPLLPDDAGELLPHRFTHHLERLVYSLLHLSSPSKRGARELPGSLPYGVRTFLFYFHKSDRPTRFIYKA